MTKKTAVPGPKVGRASCVSDEVHHVPDGGIREPVSAEGRLPGPRGRTDTAEAVRENLAEFQRPVDGAGPQSEAGSKYPFEGYFARGLSPLLSLHAECGVIQAAREKSRAAAHLWPVLCGMFHASRELSISSPVAAASGRSDMRRRTCRRMDFPQTQPCVEFHQR